MLTLPSEPAGSPQAGRVGWGGGRRDVLTVRSASLQRVALPHPARGTWHVARGTQAGPDQTPPSERADLTQLLLHLDQGLLGAQRV